MARDQKRRQKALARKAAKRKVRHKALAGNSPSVGGLPMARVGEWSLLECLISVEWRDPMSLCQILVARQAPTGEVGAGLFLVDLGCLGLKNGFLTKFYSAHEYRSNLRAEILQRDNLVSCDIVLVAKVLDAGIGYAKTLGFEPEKDGRRALRMLGNVNLETCSEDVPLGGADGKPFYFAGPRDNARRIVATLNRTVGEGEFGYIAAQGPFDPDFFE